MKLADIVRNYREQHDYSMDELAQRSGLSKGYISMIERGISSRGQKMNPSLNSLYKLSKAMNIDIDELLKMMDPDESVNLSDRLYVMSDVKTAPITLTTLEETIVARYKEADDITKEMVLRILGINEKEGPQ